MFDHAVVALQAMIEAGAAGVHFEDQLSSEKKCGHLGGALPPLLPFSFLSLQWQSKCARIGIVLRVP